MRRLAREEGIFGGVSSGGACAVALRICARGARRDDRVRRVRPRRPVPVDRRVRLGQRLHEAHPGLRHRDACRTSTASARSTTCRASSTIAASLEWYAQKRRSATGNDFPPHYLQRVVAIACALRSDERLSGCGRSARADDPEPELIRRFFDGIEKLTPQLVSWNGSGFDLPVLQHRALICGACAARYWDWGDEDREFKFNNYLGALPHAAHRPDGRARAVPAAGQRAARRDGAAVRLPGQARHERQRGRGGRRARRDRRRAQLLRDRRRQHAASCTSAFA